MLMDVQRVCLALWIPLFSIAKLRQKEVFWTGDSDWTWMDKIIRSQMSSEFWKEKAEQMPQINKLPFMCFCFAVFLVYIGSSVSTSLYMIGWYA